MNRLVSDSNPYRFIGALNPSATCKLFLIFSLSLTLLFSFIHKAAFVSTNRLLISTEVFYDSTFMY